MYFYVNCQYDDNKVNKTVLTNAVYNTVLSAF